MPPSPTKLQRWLDLISVLAARRFPITTEELWANVPAYAPGLEDDRKDSVRRTFERDKDELRSMGIPIETVTFTVNFGHEQATGYRLARRDFHLPYLKLLSSAQVDAQDQPPHSDHFEIAEDEAGAALDGLQELARIPSFPLARHARSAFRKLAFDLEPTVGEDLPVFYAEDPESAATKEVLHTLSDSVHRRKALSFRYTSPSRNEAEERRVHPYGLLFQHGRWYLVAHDVDREGERMFRVGRMSAVHPNRKAPGTPDFEIPSDFALEDYAGRRAWELGEDPEGPVDARVRFRFPRSLWAERNDHGELVEEGEGGSQVRSFQIHRRGPFLRWVLSLAGDAHVEAPEELRGAFRTMAARVAAVHTEPRADA